MRLAPSSDSKRFQAEVAFPLNKVAAVGALGFALFVVLTIRMALSWWPFSPPLFPSVSPISMGLGFGVPGHGHHPREAALGFPPPCKMKVPTLTPSAMTTVASMFC